MHYVDHQDIYGICSSVYAGNNYNLANKAYCHAIDTASNITANVSWYFNISNDQQHIGTRKFRDLI